MQRSARLSAGELTNSATQFWSLTERGALNCCANRYAESVPYFKRSLKADGRTGASVINWLWLALACHYSGENEQARHWLEKAEAWVDAVGSEMPINAAPSLGLHLHNWLEAQVLLRDATELISVRGQ